MFYYDIFRQIYFCTLIIISHPIPSHPFCITRIPSFLLLLSWCVCVYTCYIVKSRSLYDKSMLHLYFYSLPSFVPLSNFNPFHSSQSPSSHSCHR